MDYYTVKEVMKFLKLSHSSVYRLIGSGALPSCYLGKRMVRGEDLVEFQKKYMQPGMHTCISEVTK
jgi:excisionase family DNA binding protein